jgi:hypothetical protein
MERFLHKLAVPCLRTVANHVSQNSAQAAIVLVPQTVDENATSLSRAGNGWRQLR